MGNVQVMVPMYGRTVKVQVVGKGINSSGNIEGMYGHRLGGLPLPSFQGRREGLTQGGTACPCHRYRWGEANVPVNKKAGKNVCMGTKGPCLSKVKGSGKRHTGCPEYGSRWWSTVACSHPSQRWGRRRSPQGSKPR